MMERTKMKYRERIEIIAQILKAVNGNGGTTKTKIMYKAFLSYVQLIEYVPLLTENDLLQYNEKTHTFRLTARGQRFLKKYGKIKDTIKRGGLELFVKQQDYIFSIVVAIIFPTLAI
jgi:predicted transcriptional regulator